MNYESPLNNPSPHDAEIDHALRLITHASPRPGLEARVLAHLKAAQPAKAGRKWQYLFLPRMAFNALAGVAVASAVLYGTIEHGNRQIGYRPPVPAAAANGVFRGAESSHKPTAPVEVSPNLHGRPGKPTARHGRANVPLQAHRPNGVGVPKSPMVPSQSGNAPDQP